MGEYSYRQLQRAAHMQGVNTNQPKHELKSDMNMAQAKRDLDA